VDIFTVGNRRTSWQIFNVIRSYKSKVEIRRILAIQRKPQTSFIRWWRWNCAKLGRQY